MHNAMNSTRSIRLLMRPPLVGLTKQNGFKICCTSKNSNFVLPILPNNTQVNFVSSFEVKPKQNEDSLVRKILLKIPFLNIRKMQIKAAAFILYEQIVDDFNYVQFIEEYDLPDTFYSWFVITELYIWMLSVRAMAEGKEGEVLRNAVVEALWIDVMQRVKKLGAGNPSGMKKEVMDLSEQLQATLISYDEGVLSDDIVMAGAIWRRFYQMQDVHVHNLEKIVKYIRKQIALLDRVPLDQILQEKRILWLPIIKEP
ncbi:unnamed protein product [Phaedon cochleariae]|uniref:Ubiquinol-cytochrome c chaperone domain-containing protein n=1 Tax=Phaedon cochleariae TaxID=80249 RepID=A0A9P0DMM9_PHACE|nr:unnamed protein product [Phaedon cochleariae]